LACGWSKFLLLTAAGSALHGIVIVGAGMLLRNEVESALESLEQFGGYTLAALVGALAVYLAWRWRRGMITAPIAERVG
jgi:membrane protein DedA with SNARE-associated domain